MSHAHRVRSSLQSNGVTPDSLTSSDTRNWREVSPVTNAHRDFPLFRAVIAQLTQQQTSLFRNISTKQAWARGFISQTPPFDALAPMARQPARNRHQN